MSDLDTDKSKETLKRQLIKLHEQLKATRLPLGYPSVCGDLDLTVFEYEGYVAGLLSSCLEHNVQHDPERINLGADIVQAFQECEALLFKLKKHANLLIEAATVLKEYSKMP